MHSSSTPLGTSIKHHLQKQQIGKSQAPRLIPIALSQAQAPVKRWISKKKKKKKDGSPSVSPKGLHPWTLNEPNQKGNDLGTWKA